MGKCRSGLRGWWEGVVESGYDIGTAMLDSVVKPTFSRLVAKSRKVIHRARAERELEFISGLLCWGFIAGVVAARWSLLPEFLVGLLTGVGIIAGWAWMMRTRGRKRSAIAANVDLLGQPLNAKLGYERVEWLNKLLRKAWPYLASATEDARPSIRDCIEPFLETYRLGMYKVIREQPDVQRVARYVPVEEVITAIYVNEISLGKVPPTIAGMKMHRLKDGKVLVNLRIGWESDAHIILGVGTDIGIVPISIENLKIFATLRVILRITETPPFVAAVVTTLPAERQPVIDFTLNVIEGSSTVLPIVTKQLRNFINNIILDTLLWPHRLVLPNVPPDFKGLDLRQLYLRLQGQLSVTVIKGENLVNLYPYVTFFCRPKVKLRTRSIENTRDPLWNEEFTMDVEDQESQSLMFQVMNENKGPDEFVGTAVYPLKDLALDKDVELELKVKPRKKKSRHADRVEPAEGEVSEKPEKRSYGSLKVELRYHVYTELEREAALQEEDKLEEALATPDEIGSYTTATDLIHPY